MEIVGIAIRKEMTMKAREILKWTIPLASGPLLTLQGEIYPNGYKLTSTIL